MSPFCSEGERLPKGAAAPEQAARSGDCAARRLQRMEADGSADAVNEGFTRYRLSILVFDEATGLWPAVDELLASGIAPEQFCIVASPATLAALEPALTQNSNPRVPASIATLIRSTPYSLHVDGHGDLAAHCGSRMAGLFRRMGSVADDFGWMQNELSKKLALHAERGAINLLVSAAGAEQHSLIARVLLRHGRHDLQTHVFSWPSLL